MSKRRGKSEEPENAKATEAGAARLTNKQRAFVAEYLKCWNASEAARRAGYSAKNADVIGSENLGKPGIREAIDERLRALTMGADEALYRLSEMARGTMADFVDPDNATVDLKRAEDAGKLWLVKSFSRTDTEYGGSIRVELYDAQAALVQIIKQRQLATGKPTSRVEMNLSQLTDDELERLSRG